MIVIEGMDNSGKSTLAKFLAGELKMEVMESEGPPKSRDEINGRITRYLRTRNTIFVRHPCVSNPIYDVVRPPEERGLVDLALIEEFYDYNPTFVYCDPQNRKMSGHQSKEYDTAEHLQLIDQHYTLLLACYRLWAVNKAHIIYRIRDDISRIRTWLYEYQ
jgi:hypothetical protein